MVPLGHLGKYIIRHLSPLGWKSWPRQVAGVRGGKRVHILLSLGNNASAVLGPCYRYELSPGHALAPACRSMCPVRLRAHTCTHARALIWQCLPLACTEWPVKTGSHTSSIHTCLTTRQSKQLGDNVSVGVGACVRTFNFLMGPKRPHKSRKPGKAVT